MSLVKTQIYITPELRESLKEEAEEQHVSFSELVREILDERIQHLGAKVPRRKMASFIGIGESDLKDLSVNHDKYICEAIEK